MTAFRGRTLVWDIARTGNACTATSRGPIAPCELLVGTGPGVPTKCPDAP